MTLTSVSLSKLFFPACSPDKAISFTCCLSGCPLWLIPHSSSSFVQPVFSPKLRMFSFLPFLVFLALSLLLHAHWWAHASPSRWFSPRSQALLLMLWGVSKVCGFCRGTCCFSFPSLSFWLQPQQLRSAGLVVVVQLLSGLCARQLVAPFALLGWALVSRTLSGR